MGAIRDHLSAIASVVCALACASGGDDGLPAGFGGSTSSGGAGAAGSAGQAISAAGSGPSQGGAGAAAGGPSSGGLPGAGVANGGESASGGVSSSGAGAGANPGGQAGNAGSAVSRGGGGGRRQGAGGAPAASGGSGMAGSPLAGASSAGMSSAGAAGACVENLACTLTAAPLSSDIHQDCVDRINQFRTQCACLPALARWTDGEACADQMAEYDAMQNVAHAGFEARICSSGSGGQNECPGYSSNSQVISLCLQQMWSEGPGPQADCTGQCFQDHGHFINMTSTSMTKVACGFYTTSAGKVWAAQNFSR